MRSSSMGFSDFLPFRTSDRHFEFASRRCLRGDRPRSATRIDRRILLKNDLLAFGRASWIDSQSCSATWVLSPSTERRFTSLAGLPVCCGSFCGASFAKSQLRMPRRDLVARERLVVAYYAIAAATRGVCHAQSTRCGARAPAQAPALSQMGNSPAQETDSVHLSRHSRDTLEHGEPQCRCQNRNVPASQKKTKHLKHTPPSAAVGPNSRRPPTHHQ